MRKDLKELVACVSLLAQLGLSFVTPPLLLILGALWLQNRFGIGDWLLLCAIFAGILSGGCAAYTLLRTALLYDKRRKTASSDTKGKQS